MRQKQILWNAATTSAQVIGTACALFALYRFLIRTIGVERLGIWSLVLATTSVVMLANQGFSTSIVKFVAKYVACGKVESVSVLIQTALLSTAAALTVLCITLYPVARWILRLVLPGARLGDAYAILPYAFLSLWINIAGSILLAGLAGHELITHRNYVVLAGSEFYLALAFLLVPRYSLLGLAYAQTAQTALVLRRHGFCCGGRFRGCLLCRIAGIVGCFAKCAGTDCIFNSSRRARRCASR